jgi:hypothetical protein
MALTQLTLFEIRTSDLDGEYIHEIWAESAEDARASVALGSNEMLEGKTKISPNHVDGVYR